MFWMWFIRSNAVRFFALFNLWRHKKTNLFFLCIYIIMTYFLLLWPTWEKRLIPIRGYVKYFSRQWWMVRLWPISSFMLPSLTPNFNPNFARQIVRFRNVWMICGPRIWSPKWGSKMALTVLLLGHIYYFLLLDKMISCSWCLWPRFWVGASVKWKPFCQCVWPTMRRWMLELALIIRTGRVVEPRHSRPSGEKFPGNPHFYLQWQQLPEVEQLLN